MELIHGTAELSRKLNRPILTIGNFDGLHLGHQTILDTVTGRARALGGESVLYTFDPHPRKVLQPDRGPELLVNLDQKVELLAEAGDHAELCLDRIRAVVANAASGDPAHRRGRCGGRACRVVGHLGPNHPATQLRGVVHVKLKVPCVLMVRRLTEQKFQ